MSSSPIATGSRWLNRQVRERSAELRLTLRVTIAAVTSYALAHALRVPLPLWTALTSVILTQLSFGRSLKATIDYLLGTLCGAVYGGAVATLVLESDEMAVVGALALTVAPLALLAAWRPAFSAATFTGVLVLLFPGIAHVSAIESALDRILEVALGGATAVAVSLLVLPSRARSFAVQAAAQMLNLAAQVLPGLIAGFTEVRDAAQLSRAQDRIGQAVSRFESIQAEVRHERLYFFAGRPDRLPLLLRTLLRLRHDLVMIGRAATEPLPEALQVRLGPRLARAGAVVADQMSRSADALIGRRKPPPLEASEAALDGCAEALAAVRREGLTLSLPVDTVERIFALGFALEQLRQNLRELDHNVREVARG